MGSDTVVSIDRYSEPSNDIKNPVFQNDVLEFRCCPNWKIEISLQLNSLTDAKKSIRLKVLDDISVESAYKTSNMKGSNKYALYLIHNENDMKKIGIIELKFVYYLNHMSFKCLIEDSMAGKAKDECICSILLTELYHNIANTHTELTGFQKNSEDIVAGTKEEVKNEVYTLILEYYQSMLYYLTILGEYIKKHAVLLVQTVLEQYTVITGLDMNHIITKDNSAINITAYISTMQLLLNDKLFKYANKVSVFVRVYYNMCILSKTCM